MVLLLLSINRVFAVELVIGEERIKPGIILIFEGAIKDKVYPHHLHLSEDNTHVHLEARVNWDSNNIPKGAVAGGYIPYLHITGRVINEKTGLSTFVDLLPHINLIDNFHYARNITLPGSISDNYKVAFNISPPSNIELSFHHDWKKEYGQTLINNKTFTYKNINFEEIAKATRK